MPTRKAVYTAGGVIAALVIIVFLATFLGRSSSPALEPVQQIGTIELPKAPYWDESRQCLFFVDVYQSSIHKYIPSTKTHTWAKVGTEPMAFIIPLNGTNDKFVVSYGGDVGVVTWDGNSTIAAYKHWTSMGQNVYRANEGKVSPSGSLFVGGHSPFAADGKTIVPNRAALYIIDKDGKSREAITNVTVANGMAWSADASTFYFIDSLAYTVSSYAYNKQTDELTNGTVLLNYTKESLQGVPDGMAIDKDGKLWIASFGGASVLKFDPETRKILQTINLDAYQVTSVAFGGPSGALKDMYVTTGRYKLDNSTSEKYSHSGYIFEQKNSLTSGRPSIPFQINTLPQ